jgi:hypothetical protein
MKRLSGAIPERMAQRVAELQPLDGVLRTCLPTDCAAHCRAAGIKGDTFQLIADSPAWRARIQFHVQTIVKEINRLGNARVRRIEVRVGRPIPPLPSVRRRGPARTIPAEAARGLAGLAQVTDDHELRAVLQRLARRGDP